MGKAGKKNSSHPRDLAAAVRCYQNGQLKEAEAICTTILERTSTNCDAMHLLGVLHATRGDLPGAERWIAGAIECAPRTATYHNSYGNVLLDLSRWSDAADAYRKALELNKDLAEAHNNLGAVLEKTGDYEGAASALREALRCNSRYPEAYFNLANVLTHLKRHDDAEKAYRMATELKPDYLKALNNYGVFLLEQERYTEALERFERALALDPDNAQTLLNRGIGWLKIRRYDSALADLETVLRLEPGNVDAASNIGVIAYALGDFDSASAQYQWVLQRDPRHVGALVSLANICFAQHWWEDWRVMLDTAEREATNGQLSEVYIYRAIGAFLTNALEECRRVLGLLDGNLVDSRSRNGRFMGAYFAYLKALLDYRSAHKELFSAVEGAPVYVIGDSHVLALHGAVMENYRFESRLIIGVKAWHLANGRPSRFATAFAGAMATIPRQSQVVVTMGEIDCRSDEGILPFIKKHPQDLNVYFEPFLSSYVSHVLDLAGRSELKITFCGVPEPAYDLTGLTPADKALLFAIIDGFNESLQRIAEARDCLFVDLLQPTAGAGDRGRGLHHLDGYHLEPAFFAGLVGRALDSAI